GWYGSSTASATAGSVKLGQPVPDSNFVSELNSSAPQAAHRYMPSSWQSQYSPVNAGSVPAWRSTWYCAGVSSCCHCSSVFVTSGLMALLPPGRCSPANTRAARECSPGAHTRPRGSRTSPSRDTAVAACFLCIPHSVPVNLGVNSAPYDAAPQGGPVDEYEVLVIGSGPAGQKAAIAAGKLGRRAAIVERADMLGGVCVNTGTIPSKTMREAVLHLTGLRHREHYGHSYRVKEDITVQDLGSETRQVVAKEMDVV